MFRRLLFLMTAATVALAACSSGTPAAPALTDPKDILTKTALTLKDIKTMHLHADVGGSVKLDLTGSGNAAPLDLKGTTADGDIDITNKKFHLSFGAPALLGLAADIIVIGDTTYTKVTPFLGEKYTKSTSDSTSDSVSDVTDPQKTIDEINKFLNTPGVAPTKAADEKCGDKDCYHVTMNLTSEQLGGITGGLGSGAPTGTGTLDIWTQKNDLRPAKIAIAANAGDTGTVTVTLTISNYDAPVTVNAPADSDIAPAAS
jgi:lipoprotein LprG